MPMTSWFAALWHSRKTHPSSFWLFCCVSRTRRVSRNTQHPSIRTRQKRGGYWFMKVGGKGGKKKLPLYPYQLSAEKWRDRWYFHFTCFAIILSSPLSTIIIFFLNCHPQMMGGKRLQRLRHFPFPLGAMTTHATPTKWVGTEGE